MKFFRSQQFAVLCILSAALGVVPTFAQTPNSKTPAAEITPPVTGKVVEDIVARVNDQIVTQSDYDRASTQLDAEAKQQSLPAHDLEQKQSDLLRDLIDQQLLLSKGKELGITGETELIKRLDEIRKQNHLESLDDLEKAAQQQGVSYEDFKANIRNGIITQQVVRDEVGRHITMSPNEAQKYYKAHADEFAVPESVTLNEILIPTPGKTATDPPDAAEVEVAQKQADELTAKLAGGAKFEDLAKPAPTDPTAPRSVALGQFRRGMLAKEIEEKSFALNAGQYTQPIRTKQGFIILQVTQHTPGGDASFKQVEPQVEEAIFLERMQPALRQYLTKLRDEAYVQLKPGVVDTGSSGNEMRLSYSAYAPPVQKKKKKFARARFRGKSRTASALQTAASSTPAATAPAAASTTSAAGTTPVPAAGEMANTAAAPVTAGTAAGTTEAAVAPAKKAASTQRASSDQRIEKPGKREKIRFGQAPRESLPSSPTQVASAETPDNGPATPTVNVPDARYVNPDGTVTAAEATAPEKKSRLSNRPSVKKVKVPKGSDTPPEATPEELANEKVQQAPVGIDPTAAQKKPKPRPESKTRLSEKPKEEVVTPVPYLGSQSSAVGQPKAPAVTHPDPATNPPAPVTSPPDPVPPGGQQPQR